MVLMEKGSEKKFVADALVFAYEKKGFTVKGEPLPAGESAEAEATTEEPAEETPAKKTSRKTKTAE